MAPACGVAVCARFFKVSVMYHTWPELLPIGENRKYCVANSYGRVFGQEGLFIADSSMLPTAPGVNPQGTIMALAMRNIDKIWL